jgi:hypothetical protein
MVGDNRLIETSPEFKNRRSLAGSFRLRQIVQLGHLDGAKRSRELFLWRGTRDSASGSQTVSYCYGHIVRGRVQSKLLGGKPAGPG